jgi:signal transduction histidine kinase
VLAPWFSLEFPVAARVLLIWGGAATASILVLVSLLARLKRVPFSGFIAMAWLAYFLAAAAFFVARVVDSPALWPSNTLALVQASVIAILFGLAMSQRMSQQRETLLVARQDAMRQHERTAALMRERGLLFAATNHDLRQPLVGVSLFADLLKSAHTAAEREGFARKLDMALKEVDSLLVGIQQLALVHEVSHHPAMETVCVDDLLLPVIEEYRGRSEYKRLAIRYVPSRLSVTTHVPYFLRIVRNVLSNAVRYTDQGDRILVGFRRGGGLRLVIADTGRGMTDEQTQQAFDAFQRFDAEMAFPDGFGLGLFSTKSMANALGLVVSLHSRKGRGTEFRIFMAPAQRA